MKIFHLKETKFLILVVTNSVEMNSLKGAVVETERLLVKEVQYQNPEQVTPVVQLELRQVGQVNQQESLLPLPQPPEKS